MPGRLRRSALAISLRRVPYRVSEIRFIFSWGLVSLFFFFHEIIRTPVGLLKARGVRFVPDEGERVGWWVEWVDATAKENPSRFPLHELGTDILMYSTPCLLYTSPSPRD